MRWMARRMSCHDMTYTALPERAQLYLADPELMPSGLLLLMKPEAIQDSVGLVAMRFDETLVALPNLMVWRSWPSVG